MIDVRTLSAARRRRQVVRYQLAHTAARRSVTRLTATFAGTQHYAQIATHAVDEMRQVWAEAIEDEAIAADVDRMWEDA